MGVRRRKVVCADWLSWLPRPSQPPEYHQSTTNPTEPNPVTRWQAAMAPQPRACLTLPTVMHVCSAIMNELRHLHISLALVAQFAGVKRGVQRPSAPHSSPVQPEFISELHPCVPMASQPRCWSASAGSVLSGRLKTPPPNHTITQWCVYSHSGWDPRRYPCRADGLQPRRRL